MERAARVAARGDQHTYRICIRRRHVHCVVGIFSVVGKADAVATGAAGFDINTFVRSVLAARIFRVVIAVTGPAPRAASTDRTKVLMSKPAAPVATTSALPTTENIPTTQ